MISWHSHILQADQIPTHSETMTCDSTGTTPRIRTMGKNADNPRIRPNGFWGIQNPFMCGLSMYLQIVHILKNSAKSIYMWIVVPILGG